MTWDDNVTTELQIVMPQVLQISHSRSVTSTESWSHPTCIVPLMVKWEQWQIDYVESETSHAFDQTPLQAIRVSITDIWYISYLNIEKWSQ